MSRRILHAVRSLRPETGGVAEAVRNLAAAQRRRGDTVTIVSLDPADGDGESVVVCGRHSHGYGYSPDYAPWLRAHRRNFDAVIVHGLWQYQSFGAWRALGGTETPYLVFPHGMLDVWFKRAHPLKHAKKWLYWPWADYRVLGDAAGVCFTAAEEGVRARGSFWLYRANERITPIGIEAPRGGAEQLREAFFQRYPVLRHRPFLLFLGRVHPKKGVDLLLRGYAAAFSRWGEPPALVIAGPCDDPVYIDSLRAEAKALGIDAAVSWLPMIAGDIKWGALHACEAFALFSHQENFGIAIAEALACGRPVLLSDQIAVCREIETDGAGMVASDTIEGSTAVLARWRDAPDQQRAAMSGAARRCFARRFEIGQAAEMLAAVIDQVKAHP